MRLRSIGYRRHFCRNVQKNCLLVNFGVLACDDAELFTFDNSTSNHKLEPESVVSAVFVYSTYILLEIDKIINNKLNVRRFVARK